MPKLLLFLPDSTDSLVDLTKEVTTIGRSPENDLIIKNDSLSGNPVGLSGTHARFLLKDGICQLEDLNSTNGTYVNGAQIQRIQLEHGDQLQFGGLVAEFQSDDQQFPPEESSEPSQIVPEDDVLEDEPLDQMPDPELEPVGVQGLSHRPASFTSISPLKRVPSTNHSNVPLVAASVIGFIATAAGVYAILNI